jgi:hypothetical protein
MPTSRHRRQSPPADDHELRRLALASVVQGLIREALVIILREIWHGGPW